MTSAAEPPVPTAVDRVRRGLMAVSGTPAGFGLLFLAVAVAGLLRHFRDLPGPDTAWLLYAARATLEGARYAIDVAEINPPLIVWIKVPALLLADATGVDPLLAWRFFVVLLAGASLALTGWLARAVTAGRNAPERRFLLLGLAVAILILPEREFGQKEHLSIICTLPLLFLAGARSEGAVIARWAALAAGVMGGFGIAFKPHFALVGLAVEALVQLRARRPRPSLFRIENLAVLAVGVVYLGAVGLLAPAYWGFARTWAGLYHQFLHVGSVASIVLGSPPLVLFAIAAALGLRRSAPEHMRSVEVLIVACLGYYIAAVVQHKGGLGYRFLPSVVTAYAALWWLVAHIDVLPRSAVRRAYYGLVVISVALIPALALWQSRRLAPQYRGLAEAVDWVRSRREAGPILVLSTHIGTTSPLVYLAGARLGTRYPHLWQLAALYHHDLFESENLETVIRRPLGRGRLEKLLVDQVVEDFVRFEPATVVLPVLDPQVWGAAGSRRFDYLAYFGTDPRFAREFAQFRYDRSIGDFVFYTRTSRPDLEGSSHPPPPRPQP